MAASLILASGSKIRLELFKNAGVEITATPARIDEAAIKDSLVLEGAKGRDIADTLAEYKSRKIAVKNPTSIVIGTDQTLEFQGKLISKPTSQKELISQLIELRGNTHILNSAAVIYEEAKPVWRFIGQARMTMRPLSDGYIEDYVERNWNEVQYCVGGYQLENEGVRLFSKVTGDYFTVLGIPLIEVLAFLTTKGLIDG